MLHRRGRDAHPGDPRPHADPPIPARLTAGWVGLDLGTTGVRAVAVDDDGPLGRGARALGGRRDGPRHEQDPRDWWAAAAAACRDALEGIDRVGAVAVCATSGTVALVDAAGEPVSPGLVYDDASAQADADVLDLAIEQWPDEILAARIWELRRNLSSCDAGYVALVVQH